LIELKIHSLIIAGDLFDTSCDNPAELETLISREKYQPVEIYILPGNHDPAISKGTFTLKNIRFLTESELITISKDVTFFFLPYRPATTQGEILAAYQEDLEHNPWVLIGHGDYRASTTLRNDYEQGYYMPLNRRDILLHQPQKVFLGHIHAPFDSDILHYPGSSCGLDISENGIRSFLIYDTSTNKVIRQPIKTDVIYFQETLTVLPLEEEAGILKSELEKRISEWDLDEEQKKAVKARILVQGYSFDRELVKWTSAVIAIFKMSPP